MYGNGGGMGWGMGWGWTVLFGTLLVIGLVVLIVVVARAVGGGLTRDDDRGRRTPEGYSGPPGSERSPARRALDERYARGEISTEEYREILGNLDEGS